MIAGIFTAAVGSRLARRAARVVLVIAAVVLLLLACRRSGERVGRVLEQRETWREAMTFSVRCSKRQLVVLAIAMSLPSACGTVGSDRPASLACPPVVEYNAKLQARAAAEVETLRQGSTLAVLLSDYAVMRDQARACNKR